MARIRHPAAPEGGRGPADSVVAGPASSSTGAIARAFCNNEVAYLAWRVPAPVTRGLGFTITRVITSAPPAGSRRTLPAWVAFKGQSNPDWGMQDTSVWPVQKF